MIKRKAFIFMFITSILMSCNETTVIKKKDNNEYTANPSNQVILSSEIKWEQLNPARGDKSPKAGTIWGNRKGTEPTGFLVKFVDGFSSPPHIHNVSYRALVIEGLIHNDDPDAEKMWMSKGSFWTQPAGESHITAAKGGENMIYVEIDSGPYLVKPIEEAYDNGEKPINIDQSNIIWLSYSESNSIEKNPQNLEVKIAFLWEKEATRGLLIKVPSKYNGQLLSDGNIFQAIVISGKLDYLMPTSDETKLLHPGSYFSSNGKSTHVIKSDQELETIIYIRTNGKIHIK